MPPPLPPVRPASRSRPRARRARSAAPQEVPDPGESGRSLEVGPAQDAPESVEIRLAVAPLLEEAFTVALDEGGEQLGGEPLAVRREQCPHHPFDDVGGRRELMAV